MSKPRTVAVFATAVAFLAVAGCSPAHYRKSADREVYQILNQKERKTLGRTNAFSINTPFSGRDPQSIKGEELIQDRLRGGRLKPTLDETLRLAIDNSRAYQSRKEGLYLTALNLSRQRYDFRPHFLMGGKAARQWNAGDQSGSAQLRAGASQALGAGGTLGLNLVNDLLRYYTGDPRKSAVTAISANLFQPLLRGAGFKIALENLTQAERDVVYEIRSFSRYQGVFAIDTVASYFRLLQQKDAVRNEYNNYQSLIRNRERSEALAKDRLSSSQVDQARQEELLAKNRYVNAVQNYQNQVDLFKSTLALPLGTEFALDDAALEEVTKLELNAYTVDEAKCFQLAIRRRLDLLNEIDRFEDSQRKVLLSRDQLRADLNIVGNASVNSQPPVDYARFDWKNYQASIGLELNLPIDRLKERNNYRASLIAFERQLRSTGQAIDDVRTTVRDGLRNLDRARQTFLIQQRSVELAGRRVEGDNLRLQAGQAQMRDVLESQNALLAARNALTQALVDYHVARLRLFNDIGVLDTGTSRFWASPPSPELAAIFIPTPADSKPLDGTGDEVVPPDVLFGK